MACMAADPAYFHSTPGGHSNARACMAADPVYFHSALGGVARPEYFHTVPSGAGVPQLYANHRQQLGLGQAPSVPSSPKYGLFPAPPLPPPQAADPERRAALQSVARLLGAPHSMGVPEGTVMVPLFGFDVGSAEFHPAALMKVPDDFATTRGSLDQLSKPSSPQGPALPLWGETTSSSPKTAYFGPAASADFGVAASSAAAGQFSAAEWPKPTSPGACASSAAQSPWGNGFDKGLELAKPTSPSNPFGDSKNAAQMAEHSPVSPSKGKMWFEKPKVLEFSELQKELGKLRDEVQIMDECSKLREEIIKLQEDRDAIQHATSAPLQMRAQSAVWTRPGGRAAQPPSPWARPGSSGSGGQPGKITPWDFNTNGSTGSVAVASTALLAGSRSGPSLSSWEGFGSSAGSKVTDLSWARSSSSRATEPTWSSPAKVPELPSPSRSSQSPPPTSPLQITAWPTAAPSAPAAPPSAAAWPEAAAAPAAAWPE
eukprot:CAMPEP_0203900674 /NCGR_PEP_ID=MMETSP0359-20131031/42922_1 /ASSEMBLY_ACC=CAM_ASM_000338 /TAXON_ID=268821 /ORGANISM="Scrippsiella Hangoei, Strain SHTV-5" /LENGTH=485 /DNA_ID=CAMNT_0050824187 /DNA_START=60 /DNA_END=1514 /DNA_ORIENTATION=+